MRKNENEHFQNLSAVLLKFQEAGMKLNHDICKFLKTSVEYLGHWTNSEGLHPLWSNFKAAESRNAGKWDSFLGLNHILWKIFA